MTIPDTSRSFGWIAAAALLVCACGALHESTTIPGVSVGLEDGVRGAKRELDAGRRACAFLRLEAVRRSSEPALFHRAFEVVFLGRPPFDPSPRAEHVLQDRVAAQPSDATAALALADIYISRSDWARAEPLVKQAMALRPDAAEPAAVLARIRLHQGDEAGAKGILQAFANAHPTSQLGILSRVPEASGPARLAALEAAVKDHPEDGLLTFNLAAEVQQGGDLAAAEALFLRAAELDRKSAQIQAWTGRFLLKAESKKKEALDYYYRAYFLEPDYYETEFVESRIGRLAGDELARCPAP